MRFDIGVQRFQSFVGDLSGRREVIDLDHLPSAYMTGSQSGIFAYLRDREQNVINLSIYLPSLLPGVYTLSDSVMQGERMSIAYFSITSFGKTRHYCTSPGATAVVSISECDTAQGVLRGTITMDAGLVGTPPRGNWPRCLRITNGSFEIRSFIQTWDKDPFK